ncbi:type II secretion system F family protein [Moorellaceae bacterium AZ2]
MILPTISVCIIVASAGFLLVLALGSSAGLLEWVGGRFTGTSTRLRFQDYLARLGEDPNDAGRILGMRVAILTCTLVAGLAALPMGYYPAGVLFLLGIILYVLPEKQLRARERRRIADIEREFPLMVTLLKVYSRAGDLYQAMRIVREAVEGELKRQLDLLYAELEIYPLHEALDNLSKRAKYAPLSSLLSVVMLGIKTGADVEEVLDAFAKRAYEQRVYTIKRKIKAQPIIMAVIPAVMTLSLLLMFVVPMYMNIIDRLRAF